MKQSLLSILWRLGLAAISGALLYLSYEPIGWFWAAYIGIAFFVLSLSPRSYLARLGWIKPQSLNRWFRLSGKEKLQRARQEFKIPAREYQPAPPSQRPRFCIDAQGRVRRRYGFLIGFTHGMVLYLFLLPWIGEFVGAFPFIALAVYLSLWSGVLGAVAVRVLARPFSLIIFAFWYMAIEWGRSTFPFGGFAWVRLAWGQIDGPLAQFASIGGPALVSFLSVITGLILLSLLVTWPTIRRRAVLLSLSVLILANGIVALSNGSEDQGYAKIAAIQGNVPRLGLEFNAQRRAVLAMHTEETKKLSTPVDMVIWPENSSDVSPFTDAQADRLVHSAVARANAPILVGTITADEVGARNTMVVIDPKTGRGDQHNKKYLQPFGEYMPWRKFFRKFSPMVDLAGNFKPGTGNGTVRMQARLLDQEVIVGVSTCYEVAFDQAGRDAVRAGAQILTTPTNNATFNYSDMTYQQLAMSRMRAIELDRAVVVAATSGVSAMVSPSGKVLEHTEIFTPDTLIRQLPLRDSITPAVRFGSAISLLLMILGVVGAFCPKRFLRR